MNKKGAEILWNNLGKWVVIFALLVILIMFIGDVWQTGKDMVGSLF